MWETRDGTDLPNYLPLVAEAFNSRDSLPLVEREAIAPSALRSLGLELFS